MAAIEIIKYTKMSETNPEGAKRRKTSSGRKSMVPALANIGTLGLPVSEWKGVTSVCLTALTDSDRWIFEIHCATTTYHTGVMKSDFPSPVDASNAICERINAVITDFE